MIIIVNIAFYTILGNDWTYLESKNNFKNMSWNVVNDKPIEQLRQIKTIVFKNVKFEDLIYV